ncbi:MAG: multiheme c-type cytochrome, partial [Gemmatimonadota bacterium]
MLLVLNTIHLVLWGRADALTAVMVGLHLLLGVPVGLALVAFGWAHFAGARDFPNLLRRRTGLAGVALLSVCVASGGALVFTGAFGPGRALLVVHFGTGAAGLGALLLHLAVRLRRDTAPRWPRAWRALAGVVVVALVLGAGGEVWRGRESPPEGEAESFFPTGATTAAGAFIPAEEIMSSASCGAGGCHEDIYEQWSSSQHHYGSFSNPLYRRNVQYVGERLQDVASNFCGGCHDPAPTFSGQMSAFLEPEGSLADAGVSCVGCHSIVETEVIGNGSYVIERPRLYPFAFSADPRLLALNRFLIRVKPGPHRRAFLKDLHRDRSEFCAACHKVHVPKAVNQFRWVRGFDEYDAWQQSGWSGEAAASFYDAEEPKTCQGCHMEETPSDDPVERFLTDPEDPKVTVDVFAAGRGRRFGQADERSGEADAARATAMVAPLGRADFSATPGGWLRLDVVVRNRGVGHNFPAGT